MVRRITFVAVLLVGVATAVLAASAAVAGRSRPVREAQVDATVRGPGTRMRRGRIFGFVDDHVHVTGNMRAGGDVISGEPYDRFGIAAALGRDEQVHGPDGKLDLTGNLLRQPLIGAGDPSVPVSPSVPTTRTAGPVSRGGRRTTR